MLIYINCFSTFLTWLFWLSKCFNFFFRFFLMCVSASLEYVCVCVTCIPDALWRACWIPWNWSCGWLEAALSAGNPGQSLTKAPSALSHGAASSAFSTVLLRFIHEFLLCCGHLLLVVVSQFKTVPPLYRLTCWGILAVCSFWML